MNKQKGSPAPSVLDATALGALNAGTEFATAPVPTLVSVGYNASFRTFLLLRNPRFMVDVVAMAQVGGIGGTKTRHE